MCSDSTDKMQPDCGSSRLMIWVVKLSAYVDIVYCGVGLGHISANVLRHCIVCYNPQLSNNTVMILLISCLTGCGATDVKFVLSLVLNESSKFILWGAWMSLLKSMTICSLYFDSLCKNGNLCLRVVLQKSRVRGLECLLLCFQIGGGRND